MESIAKVFAVGKRFAFLTGLIRHLSSWLISSGILLLLPAAAPARASLFPPSQSLSNLSWHLNYAEPPEQAVDITDSPNITYCLRTVEHSIRPLHSLEKCQTDTAPCQALTVFAAVNEQVLCVLAVPACFQAVCERQARYRVERIALVRDDAGPLDSFCAAHVIHTCSHHKP